MEAVMAVGKFRKKFAHLITSLIPFRRPRTFVYHLICNPDLSGRWFRFVQGRKMWADEKQRRKNDVKYPYKLSVVAIMKDEGPYLREWIEYHKLVGVEKFYLYNNGSTDDTVEILSPYVKSGLVELIDFPGEKKQIPAYDDCVARHKMDTKWLALIDLDEFMVPDSGGDKVTDILDKLSKHISQIWIRWIFYGSNGHITKPDGLVTESYTKRAKKQTWHYKSIVNPRLVFSTGCHEQVVAKRTKQMPTKVIRINHYFCKSWEEFSKRAGRGDAFNGTQFGIKRYTRQFFDSRDKNDVEDRIMDKYLAQLRKNLRK